MPGLHDERRRPGSPRAHERCSKAGVMASASTSEPIGARRWAIAEGYLPSWSHGPEPKMSSHETICILNASDHVVHVTITIYFADRDPAGPYRLEVLARRTRHVRLNDLSEPEAISLDTDFSTVIESDVPIVVQHTRLDSRQAENALMSTIACNRASGRCRAIWLDHTWSVLILREHLGPAGRHCACSGHPHAEAESRAETSVEASQIAQQVGTA